ncbi:hypothetical protein AB1Y20_019206 [Prymnesium parvum]|uniref:16S rRNA (uracil(1498)-N(3))-methyltransferase n=1 Tax=Prymnesium parvum TaxID=97485 RepID=A0AB34JV45_PRYPA
MLHSVIAAATTAWHYLCRTPPQVRPSLYFASQMQLDARIMMMNRLLLDPSECSEVDGQLVASLDPQDRRTKHVREVLRGEDGSQLRAGVLDAGSTDEATVMWHPPNALDERSLQVSLGPAGRMLRPLAENMRPRLDLLLAMPRPRQFARLLPMIASLGVDNLWVTGAQRVELNYFSSHLLRKDNAAGLRAALVEGCEQSGDTAIPRVHVRPNLRKLLNQELLTQNNFDLLLVAHPLRDGMAPLRIADLSVPQGKLLLAIGPERGWEEPGELDLFRDHGFRQVTLGSRTLRTDVAVISLLAVINEWCANPRRDRPDKSALS